jgi:hypothetical protein
MGKVRDIVFGRKKAHEIVRRFPGFALSSFQSEGVRMA